ncbi:MAG TPA: hypothetical protein VGH94_14005, partial [Acidimicrobiales bacterium]
MSERQAVHAGGADTGESSQEMQDREETPAAELLIESGAVLRLSEADAAALSESTVGTEDETMLINMGPQHP